MYIFTRPIAIKLDKFMAFALCSPYASLGKQKGDSIIKIFLKNQLPIKFIV